MVGVSENRECLRGLGRVLRVSVIGSWSCVLLVCWLYLEFYREGGGCELSVFGCFWGLGVSRCSFR